MPKKRKGKDLVAKIEDCEVKEGNLLPYIVGSFVTGVGLGFLFEELAMFPPKSIPRDAFYDSLITGGAAFVGLNLGHLPTFDKPNQKACIYLAIAAGIGRAVGNIVYHTSKYFS